MKEASQDTSTTETPPTKGKKRKKASANGVEGKLKNKRIYYIRERWCKRESEPSWNVCTDARVKGLIGGHHRRQTSTQSKRSGDHSEPVRIVLLNTSTTLKLRPT